MRSRWSGSDRHAGRVQCLDRPDTQYLWLRRLRTRRYRRQLREYRSPWWSGVTRGVIRAGRVHCLDRRDVEGCSDERYVVVSALAEKANGR